MWTHQYIIRLRLFKKNNSLLDSSIDYLSVFVIEKRYFDTTIYVIPFDTLTCHMGFSNKRENVFAFVV